MKFVAAASHAASSFAFQTDDNARREHDEIVQLHKKNGHGKERKRENPEFCMIRNVL